MEKGGVTMSSGKVNSIQRVNVRATEEVRSEEVRKIPASEVLLKPEDGHRTRGNENEEFVQDLVDTAKEEGVDEALEKLAEKNDKTKDEKKGKDTFAKEDKDLNKRGYEDDPNEKIEEAKIEKEVDSLREKVNRLVGENGDLKKKFEQAEEMRNVALLTAYELAQALRQMIEEGEDEKNKKESLLQVLIQIMSLLMQEMFVPKEDDGVLQGENADGKRIEKAINRMTTVEKKAA